ncbi:MAG: response regulator, partial [Proteobacteria bacterium]|nr:response regulator [Pseudomonadota bacterium]
MNQTHRILVVDDETSMREFLEVLLSKEGYMVSDAKNGKQAVNMIQKNDYDLVLSDIRLGDITGLEILKEAKKKNPDTVVIMISAYSTTEIAVEAMNEGAYDFVPKPFDNIELKQTIQRALELKSLDHEKENTSSELRKNIHFNRIIGKSPGMLAIYKRIEQIAPTKTNVLITGESGTGKELI